MGFVHHEGSQLPQLGALQQCIRQTAHHTLRRAKYDPLSSISNSVIDSGTLVQIQARMPGIDLRRGMELARLAHLVESQGNRRNDKYRNSSLFGRSE
jgi:hypothetical protein